MDSPELVIRFQKKLDKAQSMTKYIDDEGQRSRTVRNESYSPESNMKIKSPLIKDDSQVNEFKTPGKNI